MAPCHTAFWGVNVVVLERLRCQFYLATIAQCEIQAGTTRLRERMAELFPNHVAERPNVSPARQQGAVPYFQRCRPEGSSYFGTGIGSNT